MQQQEGEGEQEEVPADAMDVGLPSSMLLS